MKKHILSILFLLSLAPAANAQEICIQVIGATGKSASLSDKQYDYTAGEAVTATFQSNGTALTQGFHQPEICGTVSVEAPLVAGRPDVVLCPNPTADKLLLRFNAPEGTVFSARIVSMNGQALSPAYRFSDAEESVVECRLLPAGMYQLLLRAADGSWTATLPFVKSE